MYRLRFILSFHFWYILAWIRLDRNHTISIWRIYSIWKVYSSIYIIINYRGTVCVTIVDRWLSIINIGSGSDDGGWVSWYHLYILLLSLTPASPDNTDHNHQKHKQSNHPTHNTSNKRRSPITCIKTRRATITAFVWCTRQTRTRRLTIIVYIVVPALILGRGCWWVIRTCSGLIAALGWTGLVGTLSIVVVAHCVVVI